MSATKVTINLTDENVKTVEELAIRRNLNKTTIVNQAIIVEKFIDDARDRKAKVIIRERDGTEREVIFR